MHKSNLWYTRSRLSYLDNNALFVYDYYTIKLPATFHDFFKSIHEVHQYNTRLASKKSYYLPKTRTNYGKFNIRFNGTKIWNSIQDDLISKSRTCFKKQLNFSLISSYRSYW